MYCDVNGRGRSGSVELYGDNTRKNSKGSVDMYETNNPDGLDVYSDTLPGDGSYQKAKAVGKKGGKKGSNWDDSMYCDVTGHSDPIPADGNYVDVNDASAKVYEDPKDRNRHKKEKEKKKSKGGKNSGPGEEMYFEVGAMY